ncbi:magnesium transporter [Thiomicrorhabdus sp.]|uniref:magnesium transporter n=1 Tax=Thiomicrorhabdus sp. TaxID=2039724 RepID=UPI00356854C7
MVQSNTVTDKAQLTAQLLAAVQEQNPSQVPELSAQLVAEDLAEILESLPPKGRHFLWELISSDAQGEILAHTNDEVRASLLEQLAPHEITEIAEHLETDDIADIVQSLNDEDQQTLLESLNEEDRSAVEMALSYPEDTAGGLMSTDFIAVRADVTLDVVLRYLRKLGELPTSTVDLFVRDREDHYVGTLKINALITHDPDTLVSDLVDTQKPTIRAYTPEKEVAYIFEKHDLISIAVLNDHNKILGRITIDDVVDIIREEGEHAQLVSAGLNEDEDIFAPATLAAKRRTFWLGINLLTAIFA